MNSKTRENRLRRMAERQGLKLLKSRRRDPMAIGFRTFGLVDADTNSWVAANHRNGYGLDLDEIEDWLKGRR
jgi:hypothetical protein